MKQANLHRLRRSAAIFLILFSLLLTITPGVKPSRAKGGYNDDYRDGEVIVGLNPGVSITTINARYNTTVIEQLDGAGHYRLGLPPGTDVEDKLGEMATDKDLFFFSPNFAFQSPEIRQSSHAFIDQSSHAFIDGQSPANFYAQPNITSLHSTEAHAYSRGRGIRVAVIDTGIDFSHPLLAGRIAYPVYDFVDNDSNPTDEIGGSGYGHGTFVAGLVALAAPDATIMPLRAFDRDGQATSFNLARAIRFATDNGARIINMSFGLLNEDPLVEDALSYAYERVYMVASAGNDNQETLHFPADELNRTIGVTATGAGDVKAPFANYYKDVQVAAPGENLYGPYPGNRWATWSGTSFSTALVSGEAALLLALNSTLERSNLNKIITTGGVNINSVNPAFNGKLGKVRIDFLAAVTQLSATPLSRQWGAQPRVRRTVPPRRVASGN